MATNQPIASSKASNVSLPPSPAQSQAVSSAAGDSYGSRRSGGSGSHGAGAATRVSSNPRNAQQARKQNKASRKFHLFDDDDAMAESAAVRSSSSRKGQTSITHLMTFSLPPRQQYNRYGSSSNAHGRNSRRGPAWGAGHHAIDKARYVHANYRFIVDPRGNYHPQSVDADVCLDWSNVLQILVSSKSQSGPCPICLSDPIAPRMAKCGHIFCLACLIRYMQADDESQPKFDKRVRWKKCPICEDSIYLNEARPVRFFAGQEREPPREGEDVVLRLVSRLHGSTLALPRDGAQSLPKGEDTPWYHAAEVMDYARIMKGGEEYLSEQHDLDMAAIEDQESKDEVMFGDDTADAAQKAVKMISEAKERLKGVGNPPSTPSKPVDKPKRVPVSFHAALSEAPEVFMIQHTIQSGHAFSDASLAPEGQSFTSVGKPSAAEASAETSGSDSNTTYNTQQSSNNDSRPALSHSQYRPAQQGQQAPSEYFFYQALLNYYLSPLDIRILREAFGNFASFPSTILPRVERVSTGHIVDDDLRKRVKYLAHLPCGCEVNFLECDWTDTVARDVLDRFKPEIERRRKRNQEKENREEKAREHAEREAERQYAFARRKRPSSPMEGRFTADDFRPLSEDPEAGANGVDHGSSPPWSNNRRHHGSAFASLASPGTSPSASRTIWGTPAVAPSSPPLESKDFPDAREPIDDGWLQGWEKDLLQESLVAQAAGLSIGESSKTGATAGATGTVGGGSSSCASGGAKKKKTKKITLMSTNVRRGA